MMTASAKADLFWLSWLMKEAQCSNVIEGTHTTLDEVMGENAGVVVAATRKDDVIEVLNYRSAMLDGIAGLSDGRELSLSFNKGLHARLLDGVRGERKSPGEFRKVQVHIGRPGAGVERALYIPPDSLFVEELLENCLKFLAHDDICPVVQAAVMHAQFELIHPFLDGSGRMGRLLISLFLASKKVIHTPCFYMSSYLHSHRNEYYSNLSKISKDGDWDSQISFFIHAVIEHCEASAKQLNETVRLYERAKNDFSATTRSVNAINILDYVFEKPIFTVPDMVKTGKVDVTNKVALSLFGKLEDAYLIEKVAEG